LDHQTVVIIFYVLVFLFAISVHESAHAWMASRCGDQTARMLGRVTLNPIKHIDILGTIILPAVALLTGAPLFGWAKPTPVNTRNMPRPVLGDILTTIAGPISNFLIAFIALIVMVAICKISPGFGASVVKSTVVGFAAPTTSFLVPIALLLYAAVIVNIVLGVFNLIPVPPLDGSHVFRHLLPEKVRELYDRIGLFGLLLLWVAGGSFLTQIITPFLGFARNIILSA
jgi:Zn-dependent protease